MLNSIKPLMPTLIVFLIFFVSPHLSLNHNSDLTVHNRRILMSFKETPGGGNVTFDCSPSGPCIPCSRSEKSEEKYRCGETGYRIRLKCASTKPGSDNPKTVTKQERHKRLLVVSSQSGHGSRAYVTYRSCIPAINEEKLSVLGFESLMLVLLMSSGSFIYFRRKRSTAAVGGAPMRLPTSSRY